MITFKNLCQIDLYVNMKVSNFFLPVCLLVRTEGEWMKPSWWRPKRISTGLLGFQSFSKWQVPGYHLTNHSRDVKFKILFDTLFSWNQFCLCLTDKTLIKIQSPSPKLQKKERIVLDSLIMAYKLSLLMSDPYMLYQNLIQLPVLSMVIWGLTYLAVSLGRRPLDSV